MTNHTKRPQFGHMSLWMQIVMLFAMLFIALCLTSFFSTLIDSTSRSGLLGIAAIQNIICFAAPAVILAWLTNAKPADVMGLDTKAAGKSWTGMAGIFLLGLPALNQVIWWNEHVNLPVSMSDIQDRLIEMEAAARAATDVMTGGTGVGALIINILIIGILTGVCEELFFRAGLQRILLASMSHTAAIWISALVFSLMHFQFFGFVPRLLLGAFFGYLYSATGSLWLNATAHALNNTLVVLTTWLINNRLYDGSFDSIGVVTDGYPLPAVISGILVAAVFIFYRRRLFYRLSTNGKKK